MPSRNVNGGIIPAYAGSTEANSLDGQTMADHPRIRGEHLAAAGGELPVEGSSPHTRGAHLEIAVDPIQLGIIPAYAGSTQERLRRSRHEGDHPRIRGEHHVGSDATYPFGGSSPHTRGALMAPHRRHD